MEILDTLRFANEKLDIKPMTRSRLAAIPRKPKLILETGDVVKSLAYIRPNDTKTYQLWTYVSYDDFKNYDYNTKLNLYHLKDDAEFKEGAFVFPMVGHGMHIMTVSTFDDNLYYRTQIAGKEIVRQITAIYRGEKKQQPLDSNYFENPTDVGKRCVWESKSIDMNEKLDIKPVTKSRLDSVKKMFSKKPKLLLESGDVLVTEYLENTRRYHIFVAEKDFKEWKVPMPPTEQDCSQGLLLCKNIIYDILAFPVSKYDDNLNLKRSRYTEKAVAIYRNRDIINPPITSTLLLMLVDNIDNLRCVWKADGANINESLGIKPVTREMLKSYSNMVKPKNLLKTGHIIKCREVTAKHLVRERTYIYLEYKDIQKYCGTIGFFVKKDEVENAEEGVFVRVRGTYGSGGTAFLYVSVMDDNLVHNNFKVTEILEDANQPSHMYYSYFKDVTEHNNLPQTITIWKSKN